MRVLVQRAPEELVVALELVDERLGRDGTRCFRLTRDGAEEVVQGREEGRVDRRAGLTEKRGADAGEGRSRCEGGTTVKDWGGMRCPVRVGGRKGRGVGRWKRGVVGSGGGRARRGGRSR